MGKEGTVTANGIFYLLKKFTYGFQRKEEVKVDRKGVTS